MTDQELRLEALKAAVQITAARQRVRAQIQSREGATQEAIELAKSFVQYVLRGVEG